MADTHPSVMWAQRPHLVFITINVSDVENPEIKVEKDSLYFKGVGGTEKKQYEFTLKFFKEIKEDTVKYAVRPRCIEFALEKADQDGPYWPRLLEDKSKQHWLKVDFAKWKDEDDSEDEGEGGAGGGGDLEEMMRNMGGLGGMGGMGGMPGMGGMGGMPGMGGMGGMDMSALAGMGGDRPDLGDLDGEDSDDEPLPDLE